MNYTRLTDPRHDTVLVSNAEQQQIHTIPNSDIHSNKTTYVRAIPFIQFNETQAHIGFTMDHSTHLTIPLPLNTRYRTTQLPRL